MASNHFGNIFRITTFGESHGPGIGVVIDGCPAGISITKEEIELELARRRPGHRLYTSPRKENDEVSFLSGIYKGETTGAPVTLFIENKAADSAPYAAISHLYRPGHANFTYLQKYGIFDDRGGGRASARETVARVAAGAIAKKLLSYFDIYCTAFVIEIGSISSSFSSSLDWNPQSILSIRESTYKSPLFCPDRDAEKKMTAILEETLSKKDSLGGVLGCLAHLPPGLGEPTYYKLPAVLAFAMLSIPATKGFEIGEGFRAATMEGSEHTDGFTLDEKEQIKPLTNHAGGTLGGISTGAPLFFKVAFKPPSSIKIPIPTVDKKGGQHTFQIPPDGKHDPCVAIRAVPIVEAMTALVLADLLLLNRSAKL